MFETEPAVPVEVLPSIRGVSCVSSVEPGRIMSAIETHQRGNTQLDIFASLYLPIQPIPNTERSTTHLSFIDDHLYFNHGTRTPDMQYISFESDGRH